MGRMKAFLRLNIGLWWSGLENFLYLYIPKKNAVNILRNVDHAIIAFMVCKIIMPEVYQRPTVKTRN